MGRSTKKASKSRGIYSAVGALFLMFPEECPPRGPIHFQKAQLLMESLADAGLVERVPATQRNQGPHCYEPAIDMLSWAMVRNQAQQHLEAVKVALALGDSLSG